MCELDGVKYSVECLLGPSKDNECVVGPEYKLKKLGNMDININILDDASNNVRLFAHCGRFQSIFGEAETWYSIYFSEESNYCICENQLHGNVDKSKEALKNMVTLTDIRTLFDCIAKKIRFQYGENLKKVPGEFADREITGWDNGISTRPTQLDLERVVPLERIAQGVLDTTGGNRELLDGPSKKK